jgi:hypothetical protein
MTFRWTPEALEAFQKRRKQWEQTGQVRTHRINAPEDIRKERKPGRGRVSKYGNIRTEAAGMKFDSRREARRWMVLRLEERAGAIESLQRQVVYPIKVNGIHICDYIADFVYEREGEIVIEDSKGFRTDLYRLKAKLMLACHDVKVVES